MDIKFRLIHNSLITHITNNADNTRKLFLFSATICGIVHFCVSVFELRKWLQFIRWIRVVYFFLWPFVSLIIFDEMAVEIIMKSLKSYYRNKRILCPTNEGKKIQFNLELWMSHLRATTNGNRSFILSLFNPSFSFAIEFVKLWISPVDNLNLNVGRRTQVPCVFNFC